MPLSPCSTQADTCSVNPFSGTDPFILCRNPKCNSVTKNCSPVELSVITSVSGLNKEIRRLTKCICQHNKVVEDFRHALTRLASIHNTQQQRECTCGAKRTCGKAFRSKRRLRMDGLTKDDDQCMEKSPLHGDVPTYAPTLDISFSMDHMPFRSNRTKRGRRTRRTAREKPQPANSPPVVDLTGAAGAEDRRTRTRRTKLPWRSTSLQKHYNFLAPVYSDGVVHESKLLAMNAKKIPKAFKLAFLPTRSMDLTGVELAVAAYIFSKDLPKNEILADVGHCVADRTALLMLAPNERVMDDVISVVAMMLSKTSSSHQWFMPTMIMQDALQGTRLTQANLDAVVCNHMRCKVDKVTEIFQPMWTDGHWYLMIIDVRRKKLIYYDSLKCTWETEGRKLAMTQVVSHLEFMALLLVSLGRMIYAAPARHCSTAVHLESLTIGSKWLSSSNAERPRFLSYEYEEPVVSQQHQRSMDCGVWVLQWMIRGALWAIQSVTAVNEQTRMRISIDLVLRSHNPIAVDVVEKAMCHWKKKVAASRQGRG
ncbi:hypothetical protein Ahy_B05g077309 [Arachis hypogaea]|uniref:Ubiquitin-like protease family profile domain-containing protein n=1 Tax=Arachis hypogaea TaxID=3818 RepID=A0A444Z4Q3_ARAHY|nr:hypothetical protein Ahy_B05g077309 [Arachis hypogaea]